MEDSSMLCEHTLLTSGDVADTGTVYSGWPAKPIEAWDEKLPDEVGLVCPVCQEFPQDMTVTACGHLFCASSVLSS
jgi:hypothetical protein